MQLPIPTRYYTPEEYLELEEKAEYKHEYRNGKIIPMTGGTTNHNKIALNFAAYFKLVSGNSRLAFRRRDGAYKVWSQDRAYKGSPGGRGNLAPLKDVANSPHYAKRLRPTALSPDTAPHESELITKLDMLS